MAEIIILDSVRTYMAGLVQTLFKKEYFSYEENALTYVNNLVDQIINELPGKKHYSTPLRLIKYGQFYAKLKGSKRTVWYAFFDKKDNRYIIKHIANNHTAKAAFLNGL